MYITIGEFDERTGIDIRGTIDYGQISAVVSLKEIATPLKIEVMRTDYLKSLLNNVVLEGERKTYVYRDSRLARVRIDPGQLLIGQTFVQRSKYQAILENIPKTFANFQMNHGAKCTALIVYGVTVEPRRLAVAHYIPPIIEYHDGKLILLDGVHRHYVTKGIGTTIESIVISDVQKPFPCDVMPWENVKPVDEKPPREKRFKNLRPELFRDLKYVGIDG